MANDANMGQHVAPADVTSVANAAGAEHSLPELPRPRMPRAQRAKIFIPFDPLHGYQDALRQKEREAEAAHRERGGLEEGA